ncbi:GNAT family N-acetyltransferase [Agilicoccus flavus]|uniref:GNAT family N-acetyltransferase n=1 Tax=Agilicoccus flavus TaxID=2775968 RepID=UPI001CF6EEA5|nr:DUF4081 domain-containing GNAT family N-acetyltransferase [Agilicoccus flavus]
MLRTSREVRPLRAADRADALALCARDPASSVYVAARIGETDLDRQRGSLVGYFRDGGALESVCWVSANLVPVECTPDAAVAFAHRVRRQGSQFSSIFGPVDAVERLWSILRSAWRDPLDIRAAQPLLALGPDDPLLAEPDPRVRLARVDEIDVLGPAAAAMFTEEIGYAPFSDARGRDAYWRAIRTIAGRGHAFVLVQDGRVVFKAEIGSAGVGACQVQGVWVAPDRRGQGIAVPGMAAVTAYAREHVAPLVTLYVNDYNAAALATYTRVGFHRVGTFATVLL